MKKVFAVLGIILMLATLTGSVTSTPTSAADCSRYFGRGYCTDYVALRIGKRQRGDAGSWQANRSSNQGQPGDVFIQHIGNFGHVGVIERVLYRPYTAIPAAYEVSEMNYGPIWVDSRCAVTNNFGRVTRRIVPVSAVAGIWHP